MKKQIVISQKKTYLEIKRLQKFSYLKRIVELREEIHSAITVMRTLRNDPCTHPEIERSICRQLGVIPGSHIFSLLAEFKIYLEGQPKEVNIKIDHEY